MVIKRLTAAGREMNEHRRISAKRKHKKVPTEITHLKNTLEGFKNRLDEAEEQISEL